MHLTTEVILVAVKGGLRWGRRETRGGAVGVNQGGLVWPGLEGWVEIKRLGNFRDTQNQVYLFPLFFIASKEVSGLTCFLWDTGSMVFIKMG